jgi:hypothetical protein
MCSRVSILSGVSLLTTTTIDCIVVMIVNFIRLGKVNMVHVYMRTGHDRRTRLCGRCHSWFLTEGAHSRFCESCRSESEYTLSLPWLVQQDDERHTYGEAVTAGGAVAR